MKKIIMLFIAMIISFGYVNAEQITVGTIERPPFMMKSIDGELSGFAIDIFNEIAKRSGINFKYKEYSKFGEMVSDTEKGITDISTANITITNKREKVMDYSQPIYNSGLQIMIGKNGSKVSFFKIIWDSGIIYYILFAFLLLLTIAHLVWFFERNVTNKRHDYFRDEYFGGIWDAFRWAFIIMTMGGFENEVPHKKISRFISIIWIVTSLFLISTLTAKITTSLTVNELSNGISSVQDLAGKKIGAMKGPTVTNYLKQYGVNVIAYNDSRTLYNDLSSNKIDAVVGDAPIIKYYVNNEGMGKFTLAGSLFKPENYGILLYEGSKYKEIIDRTLLEMQEDSTYRNIGNKYFGE